MTRPKVLRDLRKITEGEIEYKVGGIGEGGRIEGQNTTKQEAQNKEEKEEIKSSNTSVNRDKIMQVCTQYLSKSD